MTIVPRCIGLKKIAPEACIEYIISSDRIADVAASPEYQHLKTACPAIFIDIWEKAARLA
jgi:speckle-type POZ protein